MAAAPKFRKNMYPDASQIASAAENSAARITVLLKRHLVLFRPSSQQPMGS
jgi:hypothetical protein